MYFKVQSLQRLQSAFIAKALRIISTRSALFCMKLVLSQRQNSLKAPTAFTQPMSTPAILSYITTHKARTSFQDALLFKHHMACSILPHADLGIQQMSSWRRWPRIRFNWSSLPQSAAVLLSGRRGRGQFCRQALNLLPPEGGDKHTVMLWDKMWRCVFRF